VAETQASPDTTRRLRDKPVPWKRRLRLILLGPAAILLAFIASFFPGAVETVYGGAVYPFLHTVISLPARWLPFSLAECLLLALVLWTFWRVSRSIALIVNHSRSVKNTLKHTLANTFAWFGFLTAFFILGWGLNYHRQPLAADLGLGDPSGGDLFGGEPVTSAELESLCTALIDAANSGRELAAAGRLGAFTLDDGTVGMLDRAPNSYRALAHKQGARMSDAGTPPVSGNLAVLIGSDFDAPAPKGALLSPFMSLVGISGIYFPFTGEAHVNTTQPDCMAPFTACHEIAHQHGVAREDEANALGYLAAAAHPAADFRYSANLSAMRYALNSLAAADPAAYSRLVGVRVANPDGSPGAVAKSRISPGVWADLDAIAAWHNRYDSAVSRASGNVNDAYLRANGQTAGIKSYGRMVDVLLALRRRGMLPLPGAQAAPSAP
jgi:hypothetical protein